MTGEDWSNMAGQILNGIPKAESTLVHNDETSAAWDELAAYFEANPGVEWELPSEWGQSA